MLSGQLSRFVEPWHAASYAAEQVAAEGVDWPLESSQDYGGEYRYLFKSPAEDVYADIRVHRKDDGQWAVVSFNKEFHPW
jgi:hypothetical protein